MILLLLLHLMMSLQEVLPALRQRHSISSHGCKAQ
jgi:hypothetical protein